jgi:hypothetical protein
MDRKVVGIVLFGVVAMVAVFTSLTTPGCSAVQCSAVVVVVVVVVVSVVVVVVLVLMLLKL